MCPPAPVPATEAASDDSAPRVRVRLPPTFATRIGGPRNLELDAFTVRAALREVTARHPVLTRLIWLNVDRLNPIIMVFHNETLIRDCMLDARLAGGDVVDVVPAVESG